MSGQVDGRAGTVVQTNENTVRVYGPLVGEPQQAGFVDPSELIALTDENCRESGPQG